MAITVNHKKRIRNKVNHTSASGRKFSQEFDNNRNKLEERTQYESSYITSKAYGEAAVNTASAQQEAKQIIQEAERKASAEEIRYINESRQEAEQEANKILAESKKEAEWIIGEALEQREKRNSEFINKLLIEFDKFSRVINEARQKFQQNVKILQNATGTDSEHLSEVATQMGLDEGKSEVDEHMVQVEVSPTNAEADSTKFYRGEIELDIESSGGFGQVGRFTERLRRVPNVKLTSLGSCVQEITMVTITIAKPIPLISILKEMPIVDEVIEQDNSMKVVLKDSN